MENPASAIERLSNYPSHIPQSIFMLPLLKKGKPKEVIRFYRDLSNQKNDLARNLFDGPLDFGWEISLAVVHIINSRLKRMLGVSD